MAIIEDIVKRRTWYAAIGRAVGLGIVTLTKNIATSVAATTCLATLLAWLASSPLGGELVGACAGSTVLALVATAGYQAINDNGGDIVGRDYVQNVYRHDNYTNVMVNRYGHGHGLHVNSSDILGTYQAEAKYAGLSLIGVIGQLGSVQHHNGSVMTLSTKSLSSSDALSFRSKYGTHVAIGGKDIYDLVEKVITNGRNSTKRDVDYYVDWALYGYDNVNHDIAQEWYDMEGEFFINERFDDGINGIDNNMGQKICATPFVCPTPYQECSQQEATENNALHGEVYWNAYGNIDGFCNNNDDDI